VGRYENPSCIRDDMVRSSRVGQHSTPIFDAHGRLQHGHHAMHHNHHRSIGGGRRGGGRR